MIKKVHTLNAPEAIGPYSQAIRAGTLLFVSGQIPIDPRTGNFVSEEFGRQTEQCILNIDAIARQAGTGLNKTVKTTILLTDLSNFEAMNRMYGQYFKEPLPARACYEVKALPKGALVEIEAVISLE